MSTIRFRLTGARADADTVIAALHQIDDVERIEEVDDLIPAMREDSSSAESISDIEGQIYYFEVEATDDEAANTVRRVAEMEAEAFNLFIEFTDEF